MRTVQRTYTLFGIAELEDEARQKAYTDWLAKGNDYPYASENCDTLEAFCNLFRIACTNYCYDSCTYAYRFHTGHEEETERLSSVRLLAYLYNNFHAELYKPKVRVDALYFLLSYNLYFIFILLTISVLSIVYVDYFPYLYKIL